jgi:hypothetical protein
MGVLMVENRPNVEQSFYSPGRVQQIVRNFDSYVAIELNGPAARGLLTRGPTPETPSAGARQKGSHADPMAGVPIVADILRAWKALGEGTAEYRVVAWVLFQYSEQSVPRPAGDTRKTLEDASEHMAAFLGWVPAELHPFSAEPKVTRACRECGTPIEDLRSDALFCGPACRLKGWRGKVVGATATG